MNIITKKRDGKEVKGLKYSNPFIFTEFFNFLFIFNAAFCKFLIIIICEVPYWCHLVTSFIKNYI